MVKPSELVISVNILHGMFRTVFVSVWNSSTDCI